MKHRKRLFFYSFIVLVAGILSSGATSCESGQTCLVNLTLKNSDRDEMSGPSIKIYYARTTVYSVQFLGGSDPLGDQKPFSIEFQGPFLALLKLQCRPEDGCNQPGPPPPPPTLEEREGHYYYTRLTFQQEKETDRFFYVDADWIQNSNTKYRILLSFATPDGYDITYQAPDVIITPTKSINQIRVQFDTRHWFDGIDFSNAQVTSSSGKYGESGTIHLSTSENSTLLTQVLENIKSSTTSLTSE